MSKDSKPQPLDLPIEARRSFLYRLMAGTIGAVVGAVPALAGLATFFSPLKRAANGGTWIKVANLTALPADGQPYRFPVISIRHDAWSKFPPEPIGSVFLRRISEQEPPMAFSSVCPHLGCAVDFSPENKHYLCPCHNSKFEIDGGRVDADHSPSPRDLDTVAVEIRNGTEVWVDYRRFKGGIAEKVEE